MKEIISSTSLSSSSLIAPTVLDPLEFARGVLCATTFVATDQAREAHVARLSPFFERAGMASSMEVELKTMRFLREAERLEGGYWITTPVRVVELDSKFNLLVGPQPTSELQRHFANVRRAGSGRVMNGGGTVALPKQSQSDWQGCDGSDARAWTQSAINSAMTQLAPSVVADNLEVFALRRAGGRCSEPVWISAGTSTPCVWRGVGLFRVRNSARTYRYFFAKHDYGKAFLEGPNVLDAARVQYGLAALQSQPLTITIKTISGTTSITLQVTPPRSIRRLLVALCETEPRSFGRVWKCCSPAFLPVLLKALQELSCDREHHE